MKPKNANGDFVIPTSLLRFLGACVYGDAAAYYNGLNDAEREELDARGRNSGMAAWFYRYLCNVLPEEKRTAYREIYQSRQINALIGARELKRLYGVLASHGLRFAPIKGADLTYRLYPDIALRVFCDWDIWFHPDDCERALAVLAEDGWKISDGISTDLNTALAIGVHHFPGHVRGKYRIEPHFTPSNFDGIDLYELWSHTLDYSDGDGQRVLSPEMNLLMLTRHAATRSYFHADLPKLLTDAAMVIKNEKVNFAELRELANKWNLPCPSDLLAAFPEFFPSDVIAEFKADSQRTEAFRQIFETRSKLGKQDKAAVLLSRYETRGQIASGVLNQIRAHTPDKMRLIYHLPKHGARGRVLWAYVCWFFSRTWKIRIWIRRDSALRDYAHFVETVESAQKS